MYEKLKNIYFFLYYCFKNNEVEIFIFILFLTPVFRILSKIGVNFQYKFFVILLLAVFFFFKKKKIIKRVFNASLFQFMVFCFFYLENLYYSSIFFSIFSGSLLAFCLLFGAEVFIYCFSYLAIFISFVTRLKFLILNPTYITQDYCLKNVSDFTWNWVISNWSFFAIKHYQIPVKNSLFFPVESFIFPNACRLYMYGDLSENVSLLKDLQSLEKLRLSCLIFGLVSFLFGFFLLLIRKNYLNSDEWRKLELEKEKLDLFEQELDLLEQDLELRLKEQRKKEKM